jgi:hypothetical protein
VDLQEVLRTERGKTNATLHIRPSFDVDLVVRGLKLVTAVQAFVVEIERTDRTASMFYKIL